MGSIVKFKKANCWEYVDVTQQLNKNNFYTYRNELKYNNLSSSVDNADFYVIKRGDINDNYNGQSLMMRNATKSYVELENIDLEKGKEYSIPVYSDENIEGLQFTIDFDVNDVIFTGFEPGQAKVDESNFGLQSIDKGIVTFSWNVFGDNDIDVKKPLFYIKISTLNNTSVVKSIDINSKVTKAIVVKDGEDHSLFVKYRNDDKITDRFEVYQNMPNPFNASTVIKFNIPENEKVALDIYDLNGKLIYTESKDFEKGINSFKISNSSFSSNGVYYYTIKVAGDAITKKMILID